MGARAVGAGLLLVVAYAVAFALLHPLVGPAATILAVIPPVLGAALLGLRWAMGLSVITFAVTVGLWWAYTDEPGAPVVRVGSGIGAVVVLVMAAGIGHLRDLNRALAARLREHERLAATLKASEEQLRVATSALPMVVLMFDPAGRIWRSEGPGLARLGLAPGSLDGRAIFDLCDTEADRTAVRLALDGRPAVGGATLGSGPRRFSYFPMTNDAGAVTGGVGIALLG